MNLNEAHFSKVFFKHLWFYYEPKSFAFPFSLFIDKCGVSMVFAFFGVVWMFEETD